MLVLSGNIQCLGLHLSTVMTDLNAILIRDGKVLYTGAIGSIFREKNAAKQVAAGLECGITLKDFADFKEKDVIEVYFAKGGPNWCTPKSLELVSKY